MLGRVPGLWRANLVKLGHIVLYTPVLPAPPAIVKAGRPDLPHLRGEGSCLLPPAEILQAKALFREGRARVRLKQNRKGQERRANAFELQQFSFQNTTLLCKGLLLPLGSQREASWGASKVCLSPCL